MKNFPFNTPHHEIIDAFRDPKWINQMPKINFPEYLDIRLIPPFGGVAVRFLASLGESKTSVSVFLDVSNALTSTSSPVWEIYPNAEGDISRFGLDETEEMIGAIVEALRSL